MRFAGLKRGVDAALHLMHRLLRALSEHGNEFGIGREEHVAQPVKCDHGIQNLRLAELRDAFQLLVGDPGKQLFETLRAEFMQVGVPGDRERQLHRFGGVDADFAHVAWADDVENIGLECAQRLRHFAMQAP